MLTQKIFLSAQAGAEFVLWFLLILSVFSVAIMLERYLTLRSIRKNSEKVRERLQEILQSNSLSDLEELSRDKSTLEGRALAYGLRHVKENGSSGLSEIFNSYALMEKPKLEKYLGFLATVGSNAPFVGLLGTVLGIMKAFHDLGASQGEATAVMSGIAEALVSTAVGLFVAIPAVVAYNYFQRNVKSSVTSLETVKELCLAYANKKAK